MLANSLVELDRAHLIHPVASWRGHEAAGVRVLTSAKGATRDRCRGAHARRRLRRPLVRQRRLRPGERRRRRRAPASRAALCDRVFRPRLGAGDPPCRPDSPSWRRATSTTSISRSAARTRWTARCASSATTGTPAASRRRTSSSRSSRAITARRRSGAGLTALPVFHAGFGVPYDWQHKIPSHYAYRNPVGSDPQAIIAASTGCAARQGRGTRRAGARRRLLRRADPGLGRRAGAAAGWMKAMRDLCAELDILFVADEVITGFGRTGPLFACRGRRDRPRSDDHRQGADLGLRADGRGAACPIRSTRRSPTARARPRSAMATPIRPIRCQRRRRRSRCCDLYEGGLLENGRAMRGAAAGRAREPRRPPARRRRARPRHARGDRARDRQGGEDAAAGRRRSVRAASSTAPGRTASSSAPSATACSAMLRRSAAPRTRSTRSSSARARTLDQTLADPDVRAALA